MIVAPTKCFFVIKADGEIAENAVGKISPLAAADVESLIMLSADINSDIQAIHGMDSAISRLKAPCESVQDMSLIETFNPLYIPSKPEEVDEVLQLTSSNDMIKFTGMNGNPFTLKQVQLKIDERAVIEGRVDYHPFDLPSYTDLMEATRKEVIN